MSFLPVTPPPGVVKPGTVYDARGRWYHTQLVRWHEGVMQPLGGWEELPLDLLSVGAGPVAAALAYDDDTSTFVDYTSEANSPSAGGGVTGGDVTAFFHADDNHAFYLASDATFDAVALVVGDISYSPADWDLAYEYWDGSAWSALADVVDGTQKMAVQGTGTVSWTVPGDWDTTTVDGEGPYYYMRFRVDGTPTFGGFVNTFIAQAGIGSAAVIGGPVRGTHSWRTNAGAPRLALGTPTSILVYSAGLLDDITPGGLTAGAADAAYEAGNFGAGLFGGGPFGIGDDSLEELTEATTWSIDNYGEDLVLVSIADGDLWYWDQDGGGAMAAISPSAGTVPQDNSGVVVTPENFVVLLGAGGNRRLLQWPDQDDITDWDITDATNSAGDLPLPGKGAILAGRRAQSETLIWTETDVFALRYIGGTFLYTAVPVGQDGAISRRSMAVYGKGAVWMGQRGFFTYDGYTAPLPCEMSDYVFGDINRVQSSKVWAEHRAEFGEIAWHYPSAGSSECNRAVVYNYRLSVWYPLDIARTGGEDTGALPFPVASDPDGVIWQHESGRAYPDVDDLPYAIGGPIELGKGDNVMFVRAAVPDERTLGQVDLSLHLAMYPMASETEVEIDVTADKVDMRHTARQARLEVRTSPDQPEADWRLGTVRLDVVPGGER